MITPEKALGIVAGSGILPKILADAVIKRGEYRVVAACHRGETNSELEKNLSAARWVKAGQLGTIIKFFRDQGVSEVVFAGGLGRPNLLRGFWPDFTALNVIRRAGGFEDDKLLREVAREFERNGMLVLAPQVVLPELLTPTDFRVGTLTEQHRTDARLAWKAAQLLGELDVGQTAIAHRGMVVALEGIEGTDRCIVRAGELCGPGFTVVKCVKPQQDRRLDLPTIGIGTVESLAKAGAGALVIHAGASLLLDPLAVEREARRSGIAIVAIESVSGL